MAYIKNIKSKSETSVVWRHIFSALFAPYVVIHHWPCLHASGHFIRLIDLFPTFGNRILNNSWAVGLT